MMEYTSGNNVDFDYFSIRWMFERGWDFVHPLDDTFHEAWRTPSGVISAYLGDEYMYY